DTVLAVYTGPENAPSFRFLLPVECNLDGGPNGSSLLEFDVNQNQIYHIVVDGQNGARGNVQLNYGLKPVITQQPVGRAIVAGAPLNLSIAATGQGSIRWLRNG